MTYEELFIEKDLPDLLSHEEFVYYFEKYKAGDIKAKHIILEHNIALVISRVKKKYKTAPYEKKELVAAGILGLINALDKFDLSKTAHFSTFAYRSIDWEITRFIQKNDKHCHIESLDQRVSSDTENTFTLEEILDNGDISIEEQYEQKEMLRILSILLEKLSDMEREIINLYFYQQLSQSEIAQRLEISQVSVSRKLRIILSNLRLQLKQPNIKPKKFIKG